jgi:hypothetical protein
MCGEEHDRINIMAKQKIPKERLAERPGTFQPIALLKVHELTHDLVCDPGNKRYQHLDLPVDVLLIRKMFTATRGTQ